MGKESNLFDQILTHGPSQSTIFLVLKQMKNEGRLSEVIQKCFKALYIYPDDIHLRKLLAESYVEKGLMGQAEAELERVTSEINGLSSAYKLQARIYARQERFEEAVASLKRYLALNPDDQEALDLFDEIMPAKTEEEPWDESPVEMLKATPEAESVWEEPAVPAAALDPEIELEAEKPEATQMPVGQGPVEEVARAISNGEKMEEALVDLATPTLAELYFNQGQIQEAISTYEKVISNNPGDKRSEQRLARLKALVSGEIEIEPAYENDTRAKKEKMVTVLENWLMRIQSMNHRRISSS